MKVHNLVDVSVRVRCFVLGAGFGSQVLVPPDMRGLVQGPRSNIALLGGTNCYEFPGMFMIVPYAGNVALGMLELRDSFGQLWHRLEGAHAWLQVWTEGVVPDELPPK